MNFKKYHSLHGVYRVSYINNIIEKGLNYPPFIVQEKVHGANFSIWYDGNEIKYASRNFFLKDDDVFFNYKSVIAKYGEAFKSLCEDIMRDGNRYGVVNKTKLVILYGELYGGKYTDDIEYKDAIQVQKEVLYCPHNDFYGFDIQVDGVYLDVDECNKAFDLFKIPRAQTLFKGSFDECINYNNKFITTIPTIHNLPPIEGNLCEGTVIKPKDVRYIKGDRMIIKHPNDSFAEVTPRNKRKLPNLTKNENIIFNKMIEYICELRLVKTNAKRGSTKSTDFGKLLGEFVQDAHADFIAEPITNEALVFAHFEKKIQGKLRKSACMVARELLRVHFLSFIQ